MGKKEVSVIVDRAFLVMNGLAFDMALRGSVRLLRVVDLRNLEHKAELSYNSVHQFFSIVNSSFPDSKRKYEMLFLVERNTQMLKEALDRA